jgi:AcrR family transcriptional regulator
LPTPRRTSAQEIVAAARELLESSGIEAVTMKEVADRVGVKAPSLYKHVRDRADLLHRVTNAVAIELAGVLDDAATGADPREDLRAIAAAFRQWAHGAPAAYTLLTSRVPEEWRADQELNIRTSEAIRNSIAKLVGEERTLEAARTFVAFAHGFVSLELAGTFRLGGEPSAAYDFGIDTLISALAPSGS